MAPRKPQSLSHLLGFASRTQVSEDFCARVSQRARGLRQHSGTPFLFTPVASAACLLVLAIATAVLLLPGRTFLAKSESQTAALSSSAKPDAWTEEFETIVLMDQLLAVNDPTELNDEEFARLLFR